METLSYDRSRSVAIAMTVVLHTFLFLLLTIVVFNQPLPAEKSEFLLVVDNSSSLGNTENETAKVKDSGVPTRVIQKSMMAENAAEKNDVAADPSAEDELNGLLGKLKKIGTEGTQNKDVKGAALEAEKGSMSESMALVARKLIIAPEKIQSASSEGIVVVDIVVDEMGKVIAARSGSRGTTTHNPVLYEQARNAALKAKFEPSSEGHKEQYGTYTFVFTLE